MARDLSWGTKARIKRILELGIGKSPYNHQVVGVDAVLRAVEQGNLRRFLLYYAPRTGKTYVQAALAYMFIRLRLEAETSLVVVVNDREALDTQSFTVVESFIDRLKDQPPPWGLPQSTEVVRADTAKELGEILDRHRYHAEHGFDAPCVVFTTLQKFASQTLAGCMPTAATARRTVVIPDEVHRSHKEWGSFSMAMERILGERLVAGGLLYIALTGTPGSAALDRFGTLEADGTRRPFISYHLGTAVAEQMVMDPRADYTEVSSLLAGAVSEGLSPHERLRLQRLLATSPEYLKERVGFILDHFGPKAMELTYAAQGMVVCNDRAEVVRATRLARQIARTKPELRLEPNLIFGAFSGNLDSDGEVLDERRLNGFALKSAEDARRARLLFVAHKFETGYDNSSLTFLYILRRLSGTLATQVTLRHCGKRVGKIRPVTCDFASQEGSTLDTMAMYFGDVIYRFGAVVPRPPSDPQGQCRALEASRRAECARTSSRQAVEQQLLQWVQLDRLEARPVATPMRTLAKTGDVPVELSECRVPRPASGIAIQPRGIALTDTATDILLLKLLCGPLGDAERGALGRVVSRAATKTSVVLRALAKNGVVAAMRRVIITGSGAEIEQALAVLANLQDLDESAQALTKVHKNIGVVRDGRTSGPQLAFDALKSVARALRKQPELREEVAKLGVGEAALLHLTNFNTFELSFGVNLGFDSPFFSGQKSSFYTVAWNVLESVQPYDADAARAVVARRDLAFLDSLTGPTRNDTADALKRQADMASSATGTMQLWMMCHKHLEAVKVFQRVLAFGDHSDQAKAECYLQRLGSQSGEATRLATMRSRLSSLAARSCRQPLSPEESATLKEAEAAVVPSPSPFGFFSGLQNDGASLNLRSMVCLGGVGAMIGILRTTVGAEQERALKVLKALEGKVVGIDKGFLKQHEALLRRAPKQPPAKRTRRE
mmetsp:Transcript_62213/g.140340  ORF Transcript_62213/g.140340 Transcript_62213/m.140340 type:complete len:952 (+) Transcript_62213:81-2936(+)